MKELGVTHKRLFRIGEARWACSFNLGPRGQRKHVRRVIRCVTKAGAQDGAECAVKHCERLLDKLKGRWLLTLNDTPAIRAVFPDCKVKPVERMRGINNAGGAKTYKELVIHPMSRRGGRST